jgi:hypothetical protein
VAWDSARARLVVFGGHDGTARLGDTWEWDGTQWLNVTPAGTSPSPRNFCAMAFDLRSGRVLLFGGNDGSYQNDTWQWDGIGWTQLNPATQPAARQQHGMVTRIDQPDVLMCCGQNATTRFGDTWLWNGTDWRQVVTATLPAPRVALDIAYDAVRGQVVIPGGNNSSLNPVGNIAEFDGTDWVNRAQDPVILKRTRYFLAFVPSLGRTYMFGGQQVSAPAPAGTYDYQTDFVARYATFGSGCATAAGTPTLAPTHAPWLGETLTVAVTGLEASSLVFMAVGFSDTAWIGGALPTPVSTLYPQTGPGCNLQVSPEITVLLINNGGTADYQLSLPNNSALVGGVMFNQAAQLELNGNLSVSGGGRMTIGIK